MSEVQSKLWRGLVDKADTPKKPLATRKAAIETDSADEKAVENGVTTFQARQERMKWIAETKLAAHTEVLGPLDERAARRLALAAKGVVQHSFEAEDEGPNPILQGFEARLKEKIEAGVMTREQALRMREILKQDMAERQNRRRGESSASGITRRHLYQQTIKDVLSEEAFARYQAYQAEREAFRHQALRDVAVACMDTQLLLTDTQREQLETAASAMAPVPYAGTKPAEFLFFQLFRRERNLAVLTLWQQGEFERIFGPIVWGPWR